MQLSRRYYAVTKGVAAKRNSHQKEKPLKEATKTKLFLCETISLCLATFIYLSFEMIMKLVTTQFSFLLVLLSN